MQRTKTLNSIFNFLRSSHPLSRYACSSGFLSQPVFPLPARYISYLYLLSLWVHNLVCSALKHKLGLSRFFQLFKLFKIFFSVYFWLFLIILRFGPA